MAASVTDKPLILIAELSKKYHEAHDNKGPRLWTEISSGLRLAAQAGEDKIVVPVSRDISEFIDKRLTDAGLKFTSDGDHYTITGWSTWKDPDAKEVE